MSLDVFNHIGGVLPKTVENLKQVFVLTMAGTVLSPLNAVQCFPCSQTQAPTTETLNVSL